MRDRYGEMMTLDLAGGKKMVVLNGADAMQEAFVKNADMLSERADNLGSPLIDSMYCWLHVAKGCWHVIISEAWQTICVQPLCQLSALASLSCCHPRHAFDVPKLCCFVYIFHQKCGQK